MNVLITANIETISLFKVVPDGVQIVAIPTDTHVKVREFFEEWEPQYLIWNGGPVRRVLLRYLKKIGFNATMINAQNSTLFAGKSRWLPGASRNAVLPFTRVLTTDGATATRLIRGGVPREKVVASGPILEEPITLPHDANELAVVTEALRTRPLWFATSVTTPEVIHIVAAHLAASRKNHRLLLIINPRDIYSGPHVGQAFREAGFKVGVRSEGDDPEPEHQVYVADLVDELGLWYRIAPLTFIGGTLAAGGAISPFEPIALGSAIIHGPRNSPHATQFARLAQADASRQIRSAAELGIAVGVLVSPEQTARMALAGWSEITQNAETINWLVLNAVQSTEVIQ